MCTATLCSAEQAALPGLDHLRPHVEDWESAVRALSLTAAAIAESVSGGATAYKQQQKRCGAERSDEAAAMRPSPFPSNPPPSLVLPPAALKPGRVFVVANLAGAYYTLLDLLAAHKFDFRVDNLMHVGNLVAPPAALMLTSAAAAPVGGTDPRVGAPPPAAEAKAAKAARNSASVLKLVRRHSARGPMGAHECLTLLSAAAANRARAEEEERRRRQLAAQRATAAPASALSMQLAAAAAAGTAVASPAVGGGAPPPPTVVAVKAIGGGVAVASPYLCRGRSCSARMGSDSDTDSDSGSESDSDSGSDSDAGCSGLVPAPPTPLRASEGLSASTSTTNSATSNPWIGCASSSSPGTTAAAAAAARPALDNLDLVHLLGLPARVVLESYGVVLQHAGPPALEGLAEVEAPPRHHVLFSHRRAGGAASTAAAADAFHTGLSCPRPVLRCAVLPPLRSLLRSSPGWAAALAAGRAPSRRELLLEVAEQPLSDLDL
ncbi:hypothetical protein GPECTOR_24g296 [Gonium pectorale]|uniref:Uncharacterized protein n=1 Tax=Gonium pectorale TaxID=33097 RepID=A0A150GGQ8_GONPE|nr:hypothetical protein GPECTOR_24g296 [Gonium pectorale]|eukprot:KXZ49006.1 hypothetical protein GPECTOR_24g296 [Gonium pectorale]